MKTLEHHLATLGPIGFLPIAPATWGSAATALVGWFLPTPPMFVALILIVAGYVIAVRVAGTAEATLGHDAKPIIADEVVGQSIALLGVPHVWWMFATSFLLFRLFDIWKPLGAREAQALDGGWGVVADDVIAGFTACAVFHLARLAAQRAGMTV